MQCLSAMDYAANLAGAVHELKVDRDTWQAVALQYKAAFEAQTTRLQELQDICFATQAELENERAQLQHLHRSFDRFAYRRPITVDSTDDSVETQSFGTATILSPSRIDMSCETRTLEDSRNPSFKRVEQFSSQRNYGTALVEIERVLRGQLSPKARVEGLLLKSSVLQANGPSSLYDALAACSEALELCERRVELQPMLPKIHYQRGLCFYQLRMLHQAQDAFTEAKEDNLHSKQASKYSQCCDDELESLHFSARRSAFDESRSGVNSFFANLDNGTSYVSENIVFLARKVIDGPAGATAPHQRTNQTARFPKGKASIVHASTSIFKF